MEPVEIVRRRDSMIAASGPWLQHNLCLAEGIFTMGAGVAGSEPRVRRVVQTLRDLFDGRFAGRRVLEIGCGEGGFALEIARQGAEVVGLDERRALLDRARFAAEAMGLRRATFVDRAPDGVSAEDLGYFDAVLALSAFDGLSGERSAEAFERLGAVCKGLAIVEAPVASRARSTVTRHGVAFLGGPRRGHDGFSFTRASILNLLAGAGFTTIARLEWPEGDRAAASWAAFKGRRIPILTAPHANAIPSARWVEAPPAGPLAALLPRRGR